MSKTEFPIYLLRHGETDWNVAGRLQGHLDSALTPKGKAQAAQQGALLGPILRAHPHVTARTSPLGRAAQTAHIALRGHNVDLTYDDKIKEISAGSWDGQTLTHIEAAHGHLFEQARNAFELMFLSPDGEGEDAVLHRARGVLTSITTPTILITHGAFLCVLRGLLRDMDWQDMMNLSHEQGCIYEIQNGHEVIVRKT